MSGSRQHSQPRVQMPRVFLSRVYVSVGPPVRRFSSEVIITGGAFAYATMMYGKVWLWRHFGGTLRAGSAGVLVPAPQRLCHACS